MSQQSELIVRDVFVRIINTKTGASHIESRRAWNVDAFLQSMQQQYRDADEKDETPGLHRIEMATETEYRAARWSKNA